jgi:Flp pilus assembly protein TadD
VKADTLSFDELMYAATLTPLLEEKAKIYEVAIKKNEDWTAYNNLGATYLTLASKTNDANLKAELIAKAKTQFELAANRSDNAITSTNMATSYLMAGDIAKATTYLEKAQKAPKDGPTASALNENLGVISIRKGKYDDAIKYLSAVSSPSAVTNHNLGLAYLLKKDFVKAENTLEKSTSSNPDNGLTYYLRAITAARQGNETALGVTLQQAVSKDSKLKEKALNDLEFAKYASSPVFTNALK